eukprot:UN13678
MHSAKILAETEMNQHSGKILATIAFSNTGTCKHKHICNTTNRSNTTNIHRSSYATKSACARCWSELGKKK